MNIGRLHRFTMALAVCVGVSGMLAGSSLTAAGALISIAIALGTMGRLHRPKRSRWFAVLVHGLTVAGLLFALAVFQETRIDAVLIVVMLGILNRYLLRAGQRDDLIILGATGVLMAAATTIAPGIEFFLMLVTFVPLVFWALWASTLVAAAPHDLRRPVPPQMLRLAAWGLTLTFVGFLSVSLLPRYRFGRALTTGFFAQFAGASSSMDLRTGGVRSPGGGAVVLRVEPRDASKSGQVEGLYARLFALDYFDGRGFSASDEHHRTLVYHPSDDYKGDYRAFDASDGPTVVRVTMDRMTRRGSRHPIASLGRRRPGYVMVSHLRRTGSGSWISHLPLAMTNVVYKADPTKTRPILPWASEEAAAARQRMLQLPDGLDPRIEALVRKLTEGLTTTEDKTKAILGHFERGYQYSLEPLEGESHDPLVRFVFEAKAGHCELYAGAVTVMLRYADVPARVVTGYYGGHWNDPGGYLEMTDDDAHAWVEVLDDERGWAWIDATPESERVRRSEKGLAWLRDLYDAAEKFWFDRIVDFDESKRAALVRNVEERLDRLEAGFFAEPSDDSGGGPPPFLAAALALTALVVGFLFVWRVRRRRPAELGRRLRRALGDPTDLTRTLGALLEAVPPLRRSAAARAIAAYEAWRFGGAAASREVGPVMDAIRALERWRPSTS